MNSWFSMKVLYKTKYAVQKGSEVVCRYRHYQTLSICLTLIFCWIRYCPTPPSWENTLCSRVSTKLSTVSNSPPNLNCQVIPWCPSLLIMLTKPQDVFTSWCAWVTQRCFPSAAKPLVWCMYGVACFLSLLFPPLRMSAHQLLRNEHRAYKLDGGNYLQNQFECFSLNRLRSE